MIKLNNYRYALFLSLLLSNSFIIPKIISTIENEDQFLSLIDQDKPTIIMGSMETCPHCKIITPEFETLSKKHKSISFVKVNGLRTKMHEHIKNESLKQGTSFKIIGYPSFAFIKNKKIVYVLIGGDPKKLKDIINQFLTGNLE
ncbi:thioredoxin family protein [Candidatus Dependentiae bacterium]|nr:thioredoxin family protein [Candidatus Dependentiae bacterium]